MNEEELRKENKRLRDAIVWALGYTDFRGREPGEGAYWWRKELRARTGFEEIWARCPHGATDEEACPECLGAPSDDPDEGSRDQPTGDK